MILFLRRGELVRKAGAAQERGYEVIEMSNSVLSALQWDLIYSVAIIIAFVVGAKLINYILKRVLALSERTSTKFDNKLIASVRVPVYAALILAGFNVALNRITQLQIYSQHLNLGFYVAWVLLGGLIIIRVFDLVLRFFGSVWSKMSGARVGIILRPLLGVGKALVIFFVAVSILGIWGIDVAEYLFGWGLIGFATVLALMPILQDIFSGLIVVVTQTFKIGDRVQLDSGEVCEVVDIKMQNTLLQDVINKNYLSISNTELMKSKFTLLPESKLRLTVPFKVDNSKFKEAMNIALRISNEAPYVIKEPNPKVHILELGESVKLELAFWISDCSRKHEVLDIVNSRLIDEFGEAKIDYSD
ncbi:mechanosensitive ion channel family protein [Candidatus Bathyarchaeota archaeon]|nr:mechanosensitive ion channel family protein [Candidatus Bathyarchaeota archaeon]